MSNSKFVLNKIAKLFEQGLLTSKDLGNEILTILKTSIEKQIVDLNKSWVERDDKLKNFSLPNSTKSWSFICRLSYTNGSAL